VASVVAIINNALNIIGASNITEPGENSKTARVMNQMYENVRDDVFRAHPWNCLIRRATLAQSVDTPAFDYAFQYALPTDPFCLRVLEFQNGSMTYPYENLVGQGNKPFFVIEGRNLLTDSGTARIKYVARVTDPTQYDAGLTSVLAARLASEAAYAITGSTSVVQIADALYERKLREARFSDATENGTMKLEASDFIEARF
jgi:hypothetical protein